MRLLEKLARPVACTILVAPPLKEIGMPEIDALNASFLERPFDWQAIRRNAGELAFLMGDDDQYVPQEQLLEIAKGLDISPIVISKGGHLNAETGYTEFPAVLELLRVVVDGGKITRSWCGC
jgi:predicted alpha/beta hydrolase family esterase